MATVTVVAPGSVGGDATGLSLAPERGGANTLRAAAATIACALTVPLVVATTGLSYLQALAWTFAVAAMVLPVCLRPALLRNGFHPYSYFVINGLMVFVLPALAVFTTRDPSTPLAPFSRAMLLVGGAFLLFWVGYQTPAAIRLASRFPRLAFGRTQTENASAVARIAIVLYVVGWMGRLARAALGYSHLPSDLGEGFKLVGVLHDLDLFATLSYLILLVFLFQGLRSRVRYSTYAVVLIGLEVFAGAVVGGRTAISIPLLYAALAWSWARRPISFPVVLVSLVFAIMVLGPILTAYRQSTYQLLRSGQQPSPATVIQAAGNIDNALIRSGGLKGLRRYVILGRGVTIESTIRVIDQVPSVYPFERGVPVLRGIATFAIPRPLWPGKPLYQPGVDFAYRFWGLDPRYSGNTSISMGIPAQSYLNFGWAGLGLFPVLGLLYRAGSRSAERPSARVSSIVGASYVLFVLSTVQAELSGYFIGLVRSGFVYVVFLAIVRRGVPRIVLPSRHSQLAVEPALAKAH